MRQQSFLFFIVVVLCSSIAHAKDDSLYTAQGRFDYLLARIPSISPVLKKQSKIQDPQVRPFITDDARVVGHHLAQIEAWARVDKLDLQQWVLTAYGPTPWLELTAGGVLGASFAQEEGEKTAFTYALPLLQAKVLLREYAPGDWPGFGFVLGTFLPYGQGEFKPEGYGTFGFLTLSQCIGEGERILLHANAGFNYLHIAGEDELIATWGFGTQIKALGGFHLVGEFFSGDPYIPGTGTAYQVGFRHFFSDLLQIDATCGQGLAGEVILPFWVSAGVRIVLTTFVPKKS